MSKDAKNRFRNRFDGQVAVMYGTAIFVAVVSFVGVFPRLLVLMGFKIYGMGAGADMLMISALLLILAVLTAGVVGFQLSGFTKRAPRRLSDRNPSGAEWPDA